MTGFHAVLFGMKWKLGCVLNPEEIAVAVKNSA